MKKSVITRHSDYNKVKAMSKDTIFIMVQRQPADQYDPEDEMDLIPYHIRDCGNYEKMVDKFTYLLDKAKELHRKEEAEFLFREEGRDYTKFVFFRGNTAVQCVICTKEKAMALAF